MLKDGDTIGVDATSSAATVEDLLSSTGIVINGGALRNLTNLVNGMGKATGEQGTHSATSSRKTNPHSEPSTPDRTRFRPHSPETSSWQRNSKAQNQTISELMTNAGPATDTTCRPTPARSQTWFNKRGPHRPADQIPSLAGTDTSGRSMIRDLNTLAGSFNDVVLEPNATLS